MKHVIPYLVLAVALAACQDAGPAALDGRPQFAAGGAPPIYHVVGGGSIVREDIEGSPREIYGFNARLDAAGNVSGEAEVHFPSDDVKMHIDVQCLVVRGNEAWMSGPVTRSDNPDTEIGRVFVWRVVDNGEGADAPPDRISNFLWRDPNFPPGRCLRQPDLLTYPWDNGNAQIALTGNALTQDDLVGTWDASTFVYVSRKNPTYSLDILALDMRVRLTVASDGRFSMVWWRPGEMIENAAGTLEVVDGHVVLTTYEGPEVLTLTMGRFGKTLWFDTDDVGPDFDGDGTDDPARLFAVFEPKNTGILIGDLVGVWDATVFRYVSVATPADTVDLIAQDVTLTVTIEPDSRFIVVLDGGAPDASEWLIEGDQLLTRNGESQAFTFALEGDMLSVEGATEYDFGGSPEPATVEYVLVRQ